MDIFCYLAEQRIQEAYRRGEFDNLSLLGQPLDNSEYFSVPEEERMAYHLLKNAGLIPEEVQLRKNLYQLIKEIRQTEDREKRNELREKYALLESRLFMMREKNKR